MSQSLVHYRHDYRPLPFAVDNMELFFEIIKQSVHVLTRINIRPLQDGISECVLDGSAKLLSVKIDENPHRDYVLSDEKLTLKNIPSQPFVLEIETLLFPHRNKSLSGLYASGAGLFTQCEAEGFRKITYFFDRPDILTKYTVTITADQKQYPVLLSNGNQIDSGRLDELRHFATWHDPFPKPCYLFALVAGDLAMRHDTFRTMSGRHVELRFYTEVENICRTDFALQSLKNAMRWDEQRFGLEYDLDIYMVVAVGDFNMGAMENKGLNIFNTKYVLADKSTATDDDFEAIESVIGHEYFHNYTGNRVTCRDWFQLSLKEGLTVFRDQEFSSDQANRAVRRINQVKLMRSAQFAEDASPTAHPVRPDSYEKIDNFYTLTVYEKGAEIVRMYHTFLGEKGFRDGLRLYLQRHDGQAATCDDFLHAMEDANDIDLSQFALWYSQAGTPVLDVSGRLDTNQNTYTLTVKQHIPNTAGKDYLPMVMPLKIGLLSRNGQEVAFRVIDDADIDGNIIFSEPLQETVLCLTKKEQIFVLHNVCEPVIPSLLRGFSAPVHLNFPYTEEELNILMSHDTDEFSRWDAAQTLYRRAIIANLNALKQGSVLPDHADLIRNINHLLAQQHDAAFTAMMLSLPETSELLDLLAPVNPLLIFLARDNLFESIAKGCRTAISKCMQNMQQRLPKRYENYNAEIAGVRTLLNTCRTLLFRVAPEMLHDLQQEYNELQDDMTLRLGILRAINHSDSPIRMQMLQSFADKFHDNPLVLDKYFALIASSHCKNAYQQILSAQQHPAFSLENPNKVYALWATFTRNTPQFHAADGSGYKAFSEVIVKIDKFNSQVAARLTKAFAKLPKLDETHRNLMRQELEKIAQLPELSQDTSEIVHKILNG